MDFKACCFFGHRPRCPELINLVIMMIISLNEDYKELLIPSTYESEVSGYSSQVWRRPNRTKPRIEFKGTLSFDNVGREDVQASTGKTVEMFVFMAFLCSSGRIVSE